MLDASLEAAAELDHPALRRVGQPPDELRAARARAPPGRPATRSASSRRTSRRIAGSSPARSSTPIDRGPRSEPPRAPRRRAAPAPRPPREARPGSRRSSPRRPGRSPRVPASPRCGSGCGHRGARRWSGRRGRAARRARPARAPAGAPAPAAAGSTRPRRGASPSSARRPGRGGEPVDDRLGQVGAGVAAGDPVQAALAAQPLGRARSGRPEPRPGGSPPWAARAVRRPAPHPAARRAPGSCARPRRSRGAARS